MFQPVCIFVKYVCLCVHACIGCDICMHVHAYMCTCTNVSKIRNTENKARMVEFLKADSMQVMCCQHAGHVLSACRSCVVSMQVMCCQHAGHELSACRS